MSRCQDQGFGPLSLYTEQSGIKCQKCQMINFHHTEAQGAYCGTLLTMYLFLYVNLRFSNTCGIDWVTRSTSRWQTVIGPGRWQMRWPLLHWTCACRCSNPAVAHEWNISPRSAAHCWQSWCCNCLWLLAG